MSIATILAACGGAYLMLACRPSGSGTLSLAANAHRDDVTFDTGVDLTTRHDANGVSWYFNNNHSWGFLNTADTLDKNTCDLTETGLSSQKMCWHTGTGFVASGFRCGTDISPGGTFERLVYTKSP